TGAAVTGLVLILICIALSFWVAFVALLIPVILIVMIGGFVVSRRETPDAKAEQELTDVGYQDPEAEYDVETERSTGDSAA
ncbi:MAG: hypothetical protein KDB46_13605, partial [Solirubrobacterales bacterium]|nr:hypothetical protein [Solirubrobacterales bacterium]